MAVNLHGLPHLLTGDLDLKAVVKETVEEVGDNDIPGLAAEMAYHSILTLFPVLLFLAGMTAILHSMFGVGDATDRLVDRLDAVLSKDATAVLRDEIEQLRQSDGTGAALFGLLGALWSGSSIMGSAMKGLNRIYDREETRRMIPRKFLATALAMMFFSAVVLATVMVAAGGLLAGAIGDWLGFADAAKTVVYIVTWPAGLALVIGAVTLLYWLGPSGKNEWRWVTIGAVVFGSGWVVASAAFGFYISKFNSVNDTYGSLGIMILLLIWLYWTNLLLLVGAQVNRIVEQVRDAPKGRISRKSKTTRAQP